MKQSIFTRLLLLCGIVYSAAGTHALKSDFKDWDHKRIVIGGCAQDKSGACKTKTNAADYIQPSLSDGSLLTGTQNQFLESLGYKDEVTYRRDLRQNTSLIPYLGNFLELQICDMESDNECTTNAAGGSAVEVALLGIGKVYSAGKRLILIGRKGQISKHTNVSPEDARRLEELIAKGGAAEGVLFAAGDDLMKEFYFMLRNNKPLSKLVEKAQKELQIKKLPTDNKLFELSEKTGVEWATYEVQGVKYIRAGRRTHVNIKYDKTIKSFTHTHLTNPIPTKDDLVILEKIMAAGADISSFKIISKEGTANWTIQRLREMDGKGLLPKAKDL